MNPYLITETHEMIKLVERIKMPGSYLCDKVFPNKKQMFSELLPVEFKMEQRMAAPFVTENSRGVNVARERTQLRLYKCPLMGCRRVISIADIRHRYIGEEPFAPTMTPEERAAKMQADDLKDLTRMIKTRQELMCAELLQTGRITISEFADDGKVARRDTVTFDGFQQLEKNWSRIDAPIYNDLWQASMMIQKKAGRIPDLLLCGRNILEYMVNNTQFKEWLLSANSNALSMMDFKPRYDSDEGQTRFIGYMPSLNLEVVEYLSMYKDDDGEKKPFLDDDTAILCCAGQGHMLIGTVSYIDNQSKDWQTASAEIVPVFTFSQDAQQTALSLYSRCLPIPNDICDFVAIKCVR